jgi:hypothetical protein
MRIVMKQLDKKYMIKKIHLIILLLSYCCFSSYSQSFVSQDTLLNPVKIRKHIEFALFGTFPSLGLGITTYKNKHSWAFTGSIGARNVRSASIPINDMILGSFQTEYRHRIKTNKAPVFWHLDAGLNYVQYKQESIFFKPPVTLEGSKIFPNIGFGTGYFFALSDKRNIEVLGTANFQFVDTKISEQVSSVFTAGGKLFVDDGFSVILKLRYSF